MIQAKLSCWELVEQRSGHSDTLETDFSRI